MELALYKMKDFSQFTEKYKNYELERTHTIFSVPIAHLKSNDTVECNFHIDYWKWYQVRGAGG